MYFVRANDVFVFSMSAGILLLRVEHTHYHILIGPVPSTRIQLLSIIQLRLFYALLPGFELFLQFLYRFLSLHLL